MNASSEIAKTSKNTSIINTKDDKERHFKG